jgi:hypothetical protein
MGALRQDGLADETVGRNITLNFLGSWELRVAVAAEAREQAGKSVLGRR